jgi:ketosteroid isomerase-like protein
MSNQSDHRTAGELLRAYYAALDKPALEELDAILAPDCDWRFPGVQLSGPEAVKQSMVRNLSLGLAMDHAIGHLLDQGDVAVCELTATNTLSGQSFTVAGAVVCEARDGLVTRLAAYPDAEQMAAFLSGLRERARGLRAAR